MNLTVTRKHLLTGHTGAVYALAEGFAPGLLLSGGSDRVVAAWNLETGGAPKLVAQYPSPVYSLLFLRDAQLLVAGTGAGSLHFVDIREKAESKILQLHTSYVFDLAFSAKHRLLFSAGGDGQLAICETNTFTFLRARKLCNEKVRGLAVSLDENVLAVACGDGTVRIFNLPEMEETYVIAAHDRSVNCVAWHPNGNYLLSGGRDAHLKAWDANNNFSLRTSIPAHNFAIYRIAFNPEGNLFATASRDKTVKLWNAANMEFLLRINKENFDGHVNSVNALLWNESGLVSAGDDRSVRMWEVTTSAI